MADVSSDRRVLDHRVLDRLVLERLRPAMERRQMPHAVLIECRDRDLGGRSAMALARQLLAGDPSDSSCHSSHSPVFRQVASGAHPDLDLIEAEVPKSSRSTPVIPVDQVREATERFLKTPVIAGAKVMVIAPAEALNLNAVNAMLKILEEPPAGAVIILVCANRYALIDTVRSRCITIRVPTSPDNAVRDQAWLDQYEACLTAVSSVPGQLREQVDAAKALARFTKEHGSDAGFSILFSILHRTIDSSVNLENELWCDAEDAMLQRYGQLVGLDRIPELWDKLGARKRQLDGLYLDQNAVMTDLVTEMVGEPSAP